MINIQDHFCQRAFLLLTRQGAVNLRLGGPNYPNDVAGRRCLPLIQSGTSERTRPQGMCKGGPIWNQLIWHRGPLTTRMGCPQHTQGLCAKSPQERMFKPQPL